MAVDIAPIRKPFAAEEIPATLRTIADEVEAGKYGLMTTCVVVLGHTDQRPGDDGWRLLRDRFRFFGAGPRTDLFTVRGLLLTAATQPPQDDDDPPAVSA
jgi:hypothetical protein